MKKSLFLIGLFICVKSSSQVTIKSYINPTVTSKGLMGKTKKIRNNSPGANRK